MSAQFVIDTLQSIGIIAIGAGVIFNAKSIENILAMIHLLRERVYR